jgi:phage-related protein
VKAAVFHPKARDTIESFPKTYDANSARLSLICRRVKRSRCRCRGRWLRSRQVLRGCASDRSGAYRVFYYTKLADSLLIFHAFAKKTQKTPQHEIALARKRLKEMLDEES